MHDMQRKPGSEQRDSESIVDATKQPCVQQIPADLEKHCSKAAAAAADEAALEALVSGACDKSAAAADEAALVSGACDKSAAAEGGT